MATVLSIPLLHEPILFRLEHYGIIYSSTPPTSIENEQTKWLDWLGFGLDSHRLATVSVGWFGLSTTAAAKEKEEARREQQIQYVSRAFVLVGCVLMSGLRILIPLLVLRFRFGIDFWEELGWRRRFLRMR